MEMRTVSIRCVCTKILKLTVKPGDENKRVVVRCKCGQALRTRLPAQPVKGPGAIPDFSDLFGDLFKR